MAHKVAVIYNEPKHTDSSDHWLHHSQETTADTTEQFRDASEYGVLEQMQSIAHALKGNGKDNGHEVVIFSADDDVARLTEFLQKERPDAIFNCCESILGKASLEMNVAALYELFGIPFTGTPALPLGIALDKGIAKALFLANGIRTPRHQIFRGPDLSLEAYSLGFPAIVKPIREDASIGIDVNAIVHDEAALRARIEFVWKEFSQPALVEEFVDGRELNVGVIGTRTGELTTLPISEILFDTVPEGMPRIVSYEAKWVEESPMYKTTIPNCPALIDEAIAIEARQLALDAARVIGLRDYGRVDMRLSTTNVLYVLEANPNPDISEDAGFMRAAGVSGRTFDSTVNEIIGLALARRIAS